MTHFPHVSVCFLLLSIGSDKTSKHFFYLSIWFIYMVDTSDPDSPEVAFYCGWWIRPLLAIALPCLAACQWILASASTVASLNAVRLATPATRDSCVIWGKTIHWQRTDVDIRRWDTMIRPQSSWRVVATEIATIYPTYSLFVLWYIILKGSWTTWGKKERIK